MMKFRFFLFVIAFLGFYLNGTSQQNKVDSIYKSPGGNFSDTVLVKRLLSLSDAHLQVDTDSSLHFARMAILKSQALKYKKGEALGNIVKGKALSDLCEFESALKSFELAGDLLSEKEYGLLGDIHNERGKLFFSHGDLSSAKIEFNELLKYKSLSKDSLAIAVAFNNLGVVCRNMSDYNCALTNYFNSLKIRERLNDRKGIAHSYANIAIIYSNLGQYEKSLEYDYKSLEIKFVFGDKPGIAKSYNNIASTFAALRMFDSAIVYNNKAIAIRLASNDKSGLAVGYYNLGGCYTHLKDFSRAQEYFEKSLSMYKELDEKTGQSLCYMGLGASYRYLKKYSEAERNYLLALALVRETGATDQLKDIYEELSLTGSESGNYKSGFIWMKLLMDYKDSVLNKGNNDKLAELEKIYQTEKKELQIKNLSQENELRKAENANNKLRMIALSAGLALLAAFGIVTFISLRNKQKANQIITQQKTEVEKQKHLVEEKQKEILDSIRYAQRIQRSLITNEKYIRKNLERLNRK